MTQVLITRPPFASTDWGAFYFIMKLESYYSQSTKLEFTDDTRTSEVELRINESVDESVLGHIQLRLLLPFDGEYLLDMDKKSAVRFFENCVKLLK